MERIVVRKKVTKKSLASSNFIRLTADYHFNSVDDFIKKYSLKSIMRELYEEDTQSESLYEELIYKKYAQTLDDGKDNEYFEMMYQLDDEFCVSLTNNIYIYHLAPVLKINEEEIVPWNYVDSRIYAGDTWWEEDKEILSDLESLSIINFIKKYKAY
ncbi:hypothetical protein ACR6HW_08225 [Fusibacter sp. JL298sf-3]